MPGEKTLNRTNIEHALFAVLIMAALWAVFALLGFLGGQWVGAVGGIAFFAGREFTQAQRSIAKEQGVGLIDLPWYCALDISNVVARRRARSAVSGGGLSGAGLLGAPVALTRSRQPRQSPRLVGAFSFS